MQVSSYHPRLTPNRFGQFVVIVKLLYQSRLRSILIKVSNEQSCFTLHHAQNCRNAATKTHSARLQVALQSNHVASYSHTDPVLVAPRDESSVFVNTALGIRSKAAWRPRLTKREGQERYSGTNDCVSVRLRTITKKVEIEALTYT